MNEHIKTLKALAGFNSPRVGMQILAWLGASVIGKKLNLRVPVMCISGPPGSGKTALQQLLNVDTINPDLGYRLNKITKDKLLERSPGVVYAFASDQEHSKMFNVKLTVPSCRYQTIPSRQSVDELREWLKGECRFDGTFSDVILAGIHFMILAVEENGPTEFSDGLLRHFSLFSFKNTYG